VTTIFFEELVSPKSPSRSPRGRATATVLTPARGRPETGDYVTAMRENLGTLRTAARLLVSRATASRSSPAARLVAYDGRTALRDVDVAGGRRRGRRRLGANGPARAPW
jgi:hypothetical protein